MKITLNDSDIEILQNYITLLRSAKETSLLQNQIYKYIEITKIKNNISIETIKDLNKIYDEFILKVTKYFDEITLRIKERFEKHENYALEDIESLVIQLEMIRTLPDIESRTARTFYHTIQYIYGYIQQLQRDIEKFIFPLDHQSEVINFRSLGRLLLRLKKTEWIDRIYSGTYHSMIRHIREELNERADQLENRLKKLNLSSKFPQNICVAQEIIEKIESMKIFETIIPELKIYRDRINEYFLQTINQVFDYIKKTFNLAERTVDYLKQEMIELEQIINEYDQLLYPAQIYLQKLGYSDINTLNIEIENLKLRQDAELEEVENKKSHMESQLNEFKLILQYYTHLTSSKVDLGIVDRVFTKIRIGFPRHESQPNEYLKQMGYENIEIFIKTMMQIQEDYDKLLQLIEHKRTNFSNTLTCLKSINDGYILLSASSNLISLNEIDFLQEKGQPSYELVEKNIQEKKKILIDCEKYNQIYYFNDKLDALKVNNILIYISNCEKVEHHRVKELTEDMSESLKKYLREYGNFLDKVIEKNFKHIINIHEGDLNKYSEDLEMYLEELSSLDNYQLVFDSLRGANKIRYWNRQFSNYHRHLEHEMEICKISGRNQELKNFLIIAEALSCLDYFCTIIKPDNKFRLLYTQYKNDIAKMSREAFNSVIDYISKEDYANADLALSDVDYSINSKFIVRIKYDLQYSLKKLIKCTKASAYCLDGKIEQEENNRDKIREINENVEKIHIVLNQHHIIELIDEQTKSLLQNFENDINQILSTAILNGIKNIEIFISSNCFLEAEQCMKNLIRGHHELAECYTSKEIENKIDELKTRLNNITNDIFQRYDFSDINSYFIKSPKDLLYQLKKVALAGYAKYNQVYTSIIEKIRENFLIAIEKVHYKSLKDRSTEIQSIKNAFLFLPEELKMIFHLQIDELSLQLNTNENKLSEFD